MLLDDLDTKHGRSMVKTWRQWRRQRQSQSRAGGLEKGASQNQGHQIKAEAQVPKGRASEIAALATRASVEGWL